MKFNEIKQDKTKSFIKFVPKSKAYQFEKVSFDNDSPDCLTTNLMTLRENISKARKRSYE